MPGTMPSLMPNVDEFAASGSRKSGPFRGGGATGTPVGVTTGYKPALDGVRAIAVCAVMAFHLARPLGPIPENGGWLGVDVFFVLSGYLITSLLLTERDSTGKIGLRRFYVRRFLRLAPLSVALVFGILVLQLAGVADRFALVLPWSGAVSILLYVSNWWVLARPEALGSLGHVWSLSVEEQFYFVWPTTILCCGWLTRRRALRLVGLVAAFGAVAIGVARHLRWAAGSAAPDLSRLWRDIYLNSFLRPDGLFIGASLAVVLHCRTIAERVRPLVAILGAAGFVFMIWMLAVADTPRDLRSIAWIPLWGLSVLNVATACAVAWLVVAPRSIVGRCLSLRPIIWIGRRAYGIYLFHPLVVYAAHYAFDLDGGELVVAAVALTFLIAGLSYAWLETPFLRLKERFPSR